MRNEERRKRHRHERRTLEPNTPTRETQRRPEQPKNTDREKPKAKGYEDKEEEEELNKEAARTDEKEK